MDRAKFSVTSVFQESLRASFLEAFPNAVMKDEQNCRYRLDIHSASGWVRVKQFTNGTLYIEGTDSHGVSQVLHLVATVTGQTVSNSANASPSKSTTTSSLGASSPIRGKIEIEVPYIGTDESGKGDYFGALVVAGVYVTPESIKLLETLHVADSKQLKDAQMKAMAAEIKNLLGPSAWHVIEMSPKRYNELYASFRQRGKNLNHLLAWGHAKVIEMLLEKNPTCQHVIADQFGSEHYIASQLQTLGSKIELYQTPKAEINMGVAAASVLARVHFVKKLETLGRQWQMTLPLGAGDKVLQTARALVRQHGESVLQETAKLHFKTTEAVKS